jgi:hypothetical protein
MLTEGATEARLQDVRGENCVDHGDYPTEVALLPFVVCRHD